MAVSLTIDQYLKGKVDYEIPESALLAIMADRGVTPGTLLIDVTERQKDLSLADLYMWLASSSVSSTGEYESDAGWQRQRSSKNVFDRGYFKALANALYAKWGLATETIGKIVMQDLY